MLACAGLEGRSAQLLMTRAWYPDLYGVCPASHPEVSRLKPSQASPYLHKGALRAVMSRCTGGAHRAQALGGGRGERIRAQRSAPAAQQIQGLVVTTLCSANREPPFRWRRHGACSVPTVANKGLLCPAHPCRMLLQPHVAGPHSPWVIPLLLTLSGLQKPGGSSGCRLGSGRWLR